MVERDEHVVGVLAHHHGVALAERSSAHILTAESNVEACHMWSTAKHSVILELQQESSSILTLREQRAKSQGFSCGPVQLASFFQLLQPSLSP